MINECKSEKVKIEGGAHTRTETFQVFRDII